MSEKLTKEDLDGMSRVQLRRAAMEVLGMGNKEATEMNSADLKAKILEAQEGGGKKKGKAAPPPEEPKKGRGKPAPEPEPEEEPEPEPEEEAPPPKGKVAASSETRTLTEILKVVHAVGKAVDELAQTVAERLDTQDEHLVEIERKLFHQLGLTENIFKGVSEPDEFEPRIEALEDEWKKQAEGEEGND